VIRLLTPGHPGYPGRSSARAPHGPAQELDRAGRQGRPYRKAVLGEAAAARVGTFFGKRYQRITRPRGKRKALAAIARTILLIMWHLLSVGTASVSRPRPAYYATRTAPAS
jgi:transposase